MKAIWSACMCRAAPPQLNRFPDGRLEERFTFELGLLPLASLVSFFLSSFLSRFRQTPATSVTERPRPALVRSRDSS